jgi:DNA (cytosine-5)-methyltransferase 1
MHQAAGLSEKNLRRIALTPEGGGWKNWPDDLVLDCHKKDSGKSYDSVYSRMKRNEPAPTMTTQCCGLGNGRFGHYEQDRAISLREAAIFQSFPEAYQFFPKDEFPAFDQVEKHIGNAVPVALGEAIAQSIKNHMEGLQNQHD